jgi:HEPN domain-containing protein
MIGVDDDLGLVFEGRSKNGAHLVWPVPVLTPAQFVDPSSKVPAGPQPEYIVIYYFREDMFDPVSRIRRGRFYKFSGSRNGDWTALPSPHISTPNNKVDHNGMLIISSLVDFLSCPVSTELNALSIAHAMVVLGKGNSSTIWNIIHIETSFTGEELVTLKARQSLGALPEVDWSKVPAAAESTLREKLAVLEDDFHRAGAESVVDRAREAATAILSSYLQDQDVHGAVGQDLGKLIELLAKHSGKHQQRVVACAAEIPQRLHSRAKHAEQEKRNVRPIREQDAELAVQCIGVMLCDLEWAGWR